MTSFVLQLIPPKIFCENKHPIRAYYKKLEDLWQYGTQKVVQIKECNKNAF